MRATPYASSFRSMVVDEGMMGSGQLQGFMLCVALSVIMLSIASFGCVAARTSNP